GAWRRHRRDHNATGAAALPIRHAARGFDGAVAGEGLTQALGGGRERKTADEEFDCHAKSSILGRTVHSEPTTTSDAPKYTLSEAHTRRIFPRREVLGGREPHRAAALRRAVPRPLRRRARPACARGNPDRRGRHP